MQTRNQAFQARLVVLLLLALTTLLGGYAYSQKADAPATPVAETATPRPLPAQPPSQAALPDFSSIAADQGPAVVNISVSGTVKTSMAPGFPAFPQFGPNDPFQEFFKRFQQQPSPSHSVPTHALGSGFIVKPDGVILTNAHVVADANEVIVKLSDKREFKAKVLGSDKLADVAVLKIDAKDLPTVKIGDPQRARVGEWVVAIGSPFGFENTVTAGIVSAKSRTLPDEGYVPFLQTDVAINPGNSGGPLFNTQGEVIGINSQIYSRSGGFQGLSFAIPIDVAMQVEQQLITQGKVRRGLLGIQVGEVSFDLAKSLGMDKPAGALVGAIERDGPADKAGLEPGDVITQLGGVAIANANELPPRVAEMAPGSRVNLTVLRQGKPHELSVTLGELKSEPATAQAGPVEKGKLGIAVRPLSPQERSQAKVAQGLVVEQVEPGPAQQAGLQPGDIILSANGALVDSVDQLRAKASQSHKQLALQVLRGNSRVYVPIDMG